MARLFEVKEFSDKKRALAAESEVYRRTLELELRNFRLYTTSLRQRWSPLRHLKTVLPLAGAAAGFLARRRKVKTQSRLLRNAMLGWRAYRTISPVFRRVLAGLFAKRMNRPEHVPRVPKV